MKAVVTAVVELASLSIVALFASSVAYSVAVWWFVVTLLICIWFYNCMQSGISWSYAILVQHRRHHKRRIFYLCCNNRTAIDTCFWLEKLAFGRQTLQKARWPSVNTIDNTGDCCYVPIGEVMISFWSAASISNRTLILWQHSFIFMLTFFSVCFYILLLEFFYFWRA